MAFPSSPSVGDTHVEGDIQRRWDGKRWAINSGLVINEGGGGGNEDMPGTVDHGNRSTTTNIDVTAGGLQYMVITAATVPITFSGTVAAGTVTRVEVHIKHDGTSSARKPTWPAGMRWGNGAEPYYPEIQANARAVFIFTRWPDGTMYGAHVDTYDA